MDKFADLVSRLALPDEADVSDAAQALGELGDAQAIPILVDLLATTTSPRIRNAAAVGLRDLGDAGPFQPSCASSPIQEHELTGARWCGRWNPWMPARPSPSSLP